MDAFTLMKKDHKNVKGLFKKIIKAGDPDEQADLFKELKNELDAHAYMEENAFYPAMKEQQETHDLALESYEEHHMMKELLEELSELSPESEEWMPKMKVLQENMEHHIQEEEEEMFPKAKKILGAKAKEVGEEMEQVKKSYLKEHGIEENGSADL